MRFPSFVPSFLVLLGGLAPASDGLARFSELLASVRSGADTDLVEFTQVADELASELNRKDIRAVADYYAGLEASDRAQGLRDYALFEEIWNHLLAIREDGMRGAEWREERRAILTELRELAELVEKRADFVPAARAYSLAARLETEILTLATPEQERAGSLYEQAKLDAKRAIELFKQAGQVRPQLEPLCTLARLERVQLEHAIANELFSECLQLAIELSDKTYQEQALQGLASLARRNGNLLEVDRYLQQLAALNPPLENWPLTWRQAERLIHADQPERALAFLDRNPPRASSARKGWHQLRANAFTRLGDWEAARRETEASGDDPLRLARIDLGQGNFERSLQRLGGALPAGANPRTRLLWHTTRGEALLALDRLDKALSEFEVARELGSQLETRLAIEDGEAEGRSNFEGEVMGMYGTGLFAEALAKDGRLLEAAAAIEEAQAGRLRTSSQQLDVRAWSEHYEAGLITWIVGPDRSLRVEVPGHGAAPSFAVIERGRVELERAVRRLREALCDDRLERAREIGGDIARDFFSSDESQAGRVLLLLHGPLEGLPVEWLIESGLINPGWVPAVLPGLPSMRPGEAQVAMSWSLLGAPTASGEAPLLAAAEELRELKKLRPDASVIQGDEFDRSHFFSALAPGSGVHLATHLVQVDNGLRKEPRLVLSDGASISSTEIRAASPELALCILATCESGGGRVVDGEGAQGIAQAFLESGTRNLIVTAWPVSDEASRTFSKALHNALLSGASPARAAAAARLALREARFGAADWAAFRALGRE